MRGPERTMLTHPSARRVGLIASLILLVGIALYAHTRLWGADTEGRDIYYSWVEGSRILQGEDPYTRILTGDMLENDKYATYFPLFYALSAGSQALGLRDYASWLAAWRIVFLVSQVAIGLVIWLIYAQYRQWLAGLLAAMLWWFNSWSLIVTYIAHLDTIPNMVWIIALILLTPCDMFMRRLAPNAEV